jgi:tetratricopeptide (TPR) repeat protein
VGDVERLSDKAGATLLRDNGVWGTDKELKAAAHDFGGHPLALSLLAGFLKETQLGDVRRRDHIREFLADPDNPRHDHARRVMESYEQEWLAGQPVLLAAMHMVGLFDRPASGSCLQALRKKPVIKGLTDNIVRLKEHEWQRALARLREVRLLAPRDPSAPDALDAHPLVRDWFGERLRQTSEKAWRAAHGRLYQHLRDTTKEGQTPTLESLAPLYQAIAHGCRAGRHKETLDEIYQDRICRWLPNGTPEFYATIKLGAIGSDLAAITWFFDEPYETPVTTLTKADRSWVLGEAAGFLRAQGRFSEALPAYRASLRMDETANEWHNAAIAAANVSQAELLAGEVGAAVASGALSVEHADRSRDEASMMINRATQADALHAAGRRDEAKALFADAELRQREWKPRYPLLFSLRGYWYCDLWLAEEGWTVARDRATQTIEIARDGARLLDIALDTLTLGRADLGLALAGTSQAGAAQERGEHARTAGTYLDQAVEGLRAAGLKEQIPRGFLTRAAYRRSVGDWDAAAHDLEEVEEIAEPGPMRLFLCETALERARLCFARLEAFGPLNGMLDGSPPEPVVPPPDETARLTEEAQANVNKARKLIAECSYHRRDKELAELEAVLVGKRHFADLPPRV